MPPKAVLTSKFFAPLRTTDMETETTEAKNTLPIRRLPENQVGSQPAIVMTSTTNPIRLQSDLKTASKESMSSEIHKMKPVL
jgi:hypothetical protein